MRVSCLQVVLCIGLLTRVAAPAQPAVSITPLVTFYSSIPALGNLPQTALLQGQDGNFYGTTSSGGAWGGFSTAYGTIFRLTPSGQFTVLHLFSAADPCGNTPFGLIQGRDGSFYGATSKGTTNSGGAVYKMTVASADAPWIQSVTPSPDGTTLKWLALKGRDYQVQSCSDLSATWTDVGSPVTATSQLATASDQTSSDGQRFYRVALLP